MKCKKCGSKMQLFSVSMGKGGREARWAKSKALGLKRGSLQGG